MNPGPDGVTAANVDFSNCDREQIQFAGGIQPHGAMLVLALPALHVVQASANAGELLNRPDAGDLSNKGLRDILDDQSAGLLLARLEEHLDVLGTTVLHLARITLPTGLFDAFAHLQDDHVLLELERVPQTAVPALLDLYSNLQPVVARLRATTGLQELLEQACVQIRTFTGYNRVMAYKFLDDGSGDVIAESIADGLEAYRGLRYPTTDIPAPARRLFGLSLLRHLPDVSYEPVPLVPLLNPTTGRPLDLSRSLLRSVSVMYTGYLKNMGAHSTMVLPLMKEGLLWGLVSCMHHAGPKHVLHEIRVATELLATTLSLLLASKEDAETYDYRLRMKTATDCLVRQMASEPVFHHGLVSGDENLLSCVEANGAALVIDDEVVLMGRTPTEDQVRSLVRWLAARRGEEPTFATDRLPSLLPEAETFVDTAAGVLATRLGRGRPDCLLWFRPEIAQTVHWAGNPEKPMLAVEQDGAIVLSPRQSFARYQQTVQGRSEPWREIEIEAVTMLRLAVIEVILRQAEQLQRVNQELLQSNLELDSFAYVASHDLKEPLRGIHNFTSLLLRSHGARLEQDGRARLETVLRLTRRMDDLIESLLQYSRVGRVELDFEAVDLNDVVDEAVGTFQTQIAAVGVDVRRPKRLPVVRCDRIRMTEVFVNLISNAIKYNDKNDPWVEIGFDADLPAPAVYVRDNGIGIEPEHGDRVFEIFKRLHGQSAFGGGAGVGLTIVRRIIERHNGRIWIQSDPGIGTKFLFILPDTDEASQDNIDA